MPKVDKHADLGYLGEDFQYRLVKVFIEDKEFFVGLQHIVDPNMFTNEHLRRIVSFLKDRYSDVECVATYKDLEVMSRSQIADAISIDLVLATLKRIEQADLNGLDLIKSETEKFFKQQNLIKAINKAQDIIKLGNSSRYFEIEELIKKALETNVTHDKSFGVFDNLEKVLSDDYRQTISTGVPELDDSLGGGLGVGELGLIIAPSNVGKSSICTGFAAEAAITRDEYNNYKGYKVLHFFFEDRDMNIQRKYYGHLLDIDAMNLSDPQIRPLAIQRLKEDNDINKMIKENIRCERLVSGEMTASDIKQKIKQHIAHGFKPNLVIVDYFECTKLEKTEYRNDSEWSREAVTMRKYESMCNEMNIAMWIPVQGTKGSIGADFVGLQHAGGAVQKVQIGHVIISLARSDEQKTQGRINLYIQKLRATRFKRDVFKNIGFNNGTCRFDMSVGDDVSDNPLENNIVNKQYEIARNVKQGVYK
jgi:KaiC/GvpD/RAD55 family RecA-like ATPase